jgi:hypothetical protein
VAPPFDRGAGAPSADRLLDGSPETAEPGRDVRAEMNTQRAPAPLRQHLEVAAGLRRLHDAEAIALAGHRQLLGEGHAEDLGTEARAAHAEQQGVREAGLSHVLGDAPELVDPPELLVHDLEPSDPARLGPAGPEVRVARPEPLDLALLGPLAECGGNGGIEIGRHGPGPRVQHIDSPAMLGPRVRSG